MGESIANLRRYPDKMIGETATSNPALEVSVSFGRFESDSLSWERFSAFSPNKYLEEVEKCATPGSVAQKKAYFEAHYKKIAARKAELLELERQAQSDINGGDPSFEASSSHEEDNGTETEEVEQELNVLSDEISDAIIRDCSKEEEIDNSVIGDLLREAEENEASNEVEVLPIESIPEKIESILEIREINAMEVKVLEIETKPDKVESLKLVESIVERDSDIKEVVVKEVEVVSVDLNKPEKIETLKIVKTELSCDSNVSAVKPKPKVTPVNKEKTVAKTKKKPISPSPIAKTPKSSLIPRLSNSVFSRQSVPAKSQNLVNKKGDMNNTPSLLKNRSSSAAGESKKVVSKSLNMSSSYGPVKSDSPSQIPNRKSVFMEKMGDRDIVKRAFKAFQNSFNPVQSYGDGFPLQKQVPAKITETKISSTVTPRKENGGLRKLDLSDKRSVKTPTRSFDSKSDKSEKRKEVTKKLEQKLPSAIEAEKARSQLRSKETKDAERIKRSPALNFKATPMPTFYQEHKLSKSAMDKMPSKNETRR